MRIAITPTAEAGSKLAAKLLVPQVKPGFRLGLATGSTPKDSTPSCVKPTPKQISL